jgi:hypothetical protein
MNNNSVLEKPVVGKKDSCCKSGSMLSHVLSANASAKEYCVVGLSAFLIGMVAIALAVTAVDSVSVATGAQGLLRDGESIQELLRLSSMAAAATLSFVTAAAIAIRAMSIQRGV